MAFPHASLIIDPEEEHANDIQVVLGHTNEPAYGKLPGIHDGKHFLEVDLSDAATTLPIPNATLFADKYYFKNIASFQRAESLEDADAIELNVPISAVFGQPGTFYNRQVIDAGIYGYTIRGTINYYDVALVPLENATKFCSIPGQDLTKFDTPEDSWTGSYGCPQNIKSIFFPPASKYPDNNYNNYPPKYDQYGDDGYGNYQQQQYDNNNNNNYYGYVNEEYQQYDNINNNNNNYDDKRDNGRDDKKDNDQNDSRDNKKNDKKDDSKEYDKNYDNNDNNNDYQYRYEYTDDNGEYGNEYASYEEE